MVMPTEAKFGIESMVGCPGNCTGCILSSSERRSEGFWKPEVQRAAGLFIRDRLGRISFETVTLLFGQGDHFQIADDDLAGLVRWGAWATHGQGTAMVSVSGIGREDEIGHKAAILHEAAIANGLPIGISLVLDFNKAFHAKFRPVYERNIARLLREFGHVDLVVNIGPDFVDLVTPRDMDGFIRTNGFKHISVNLLPVISTAASFAPRWREIMDWLSSFNQGWARSDAYEINYGFRVSSLLGEAAELDPESVAGALERRLAHNVYIDNHGRLSFMLEGIGDGIAYRDRFGFREVGNVGVPPDIERHAAATARRALAGYARYEACRSCPHLGACGMAGLNIVARVMAGREGVGSPDCPISVRGLIDSVAEANASDGAYRTAFESDGIMRSMACRTHIPHRAGRDGFSFSRIVGGPDGGEVG